MQLSYVHRERAMVVARVTEERRMQSKCPVPLVSKSRRVGQTVKVGKTS